MKAEFRRKEDGLFKIILAHTGVRNAVRKCCCDVEEKSELYFVSGEMINHLNRRYSDVLQSLNFSANQTDRYGRATQTATMMWEQARP
jgi:hypothetical protein